MEESLINRLLALIKRGVCGHKYMGDNLSILGHRKDLWYLKAHCLKCQTQSLIAVVLKEDRIREPVTDLTSKEIRKFRDTGAITSDEVLDMHNFLKEFRGNLSQLIGRRQVES